MNQIIKQKRLLALDIVRGVTIAGMILVNNPGSYSYIYDPLRHAVWNGLTPTDLVFPFFMFIMGISTYISLRKHEFKLSFSTVCKILKRTALIFLIGVAIEWFSRFCFYWSAAPVELTFFENLRASVVSFDNLRISGVLQRLALCYAATALITLMIKHRYIPYLIAVLLLGYWVILLAGNGFEYNETNLLSLVDRFVITPFHMYGDNGIDPEGVLSTVPSIAHVLLGFWAGCLLLGGSNVPRRNESLNSQLLILLLLGVVLTFSGLLLSYGCPINKKNWSPTFVLTTCGLASSLLALLIWIIDVKGYKRWCLIFESFGINPSFLYILGSLLAILFGSIYIPSENGSMSIRDSLYNYLFQPFWGNKGGSLLYALCFVLLNWSIGYQLYKRKIYIKL